jgi:hypothetical protein
VKCRTAHSQEVQGGSRHSSVSTNAFFAATAQLMYMAPVMLLFRARKVAPKTGRFELADKGTLFLDEVGDIAASCVTSVVTDRFDNTDFKATSQTKLNRNRRNCQRLEAPGSGCEIGILMAGDGLLVGWHEPDESGGSRLDL